MPHDCIGSPQVSQKSALETTGLSSIGFLSMIMEAHQNLLLSFTT
jgi:hypothetical protein